MPALNHGAHTGDDIGDNVLPIGGFVLPLLESSPIPSNALGIHDSVPHVEPTGSTAGSQPPCDEVPEIVFDPIPSYFHPIEGRLMRREVQESNPFSIPRKLEQSFITGEHERYKIPPFKTTSFPHLACPRHHREIDPKEHGGWLKVMHPDGTVYFHNVFKLDGGSCSIFTEVDLYGEAMLDEVTLFARYIWKHCGSVIGNEEYEVVINVKIDSDADRIIWSYYFVDHARRMPCWMRPFSPSDYMRTTEKLGMASPDHLQYLLRAMEHCALFPCHSRGVRTFPEEAHVTLIADLAWCASESVIAPIRYTAPFTKEEAVHLRDQVKCLRERTPDISTSILGMTSDIENHVESAHPEKYTEVAARIMAMLERWRYDFLHGTQVVRRFRGQAARPPPSHSVLYQILLPVLFYAPLSHLHDCDGVYLDGILAYEPEWTKHVKKLLAEWVDFVLYATILLAANLAFLSVPNTILFPDGDGDLSNSSNASSGFQHELVSPAAILSYCSMIASIGSMTIGLLLIRQHRGEEIMDNPRTDKDRFMEMRRSKRSGFEHLSILYSLPYAFLMWSIGMFLAALMTFTLLGTDWPTRATTITMLAIVVTMTIWCIRMGWDNSQTRDFFQHRKEGWPPTPFDKAAHEIKSPEAVQMSLRSKGNDSHLHGRFLARTESADTKWGV
ncbi:hypothetical protein PENSPDRAFT_759670 [Peniophora sp. CONT]|nr:hypothetical protein PENSPDRAFT_759670 [Peniophora sp. CONT]